MLLQFEGVVTMNFKKNRKKWAVPGLLALAPLALSAPLHAADAPPAKPTIGSQPAEKVLFPGSSSTLQPLKPDIGWTAPVTP